MTWVIATSLLLVAISGAAPGCASGGVEDDAGSGGSIDARPAGDVGVRDSTTPPPSDASDDAGPGPDLCGTITCDLFERCVAGACAPYPACAGDGSCPAGEICHARHCVPGTADIDGDGSPASEDCDETDPTRSPLEPEICNMVDDDCDTMVDDGDPTVLCSTNPGGGVCMAGSCGCPPGTFDLDRAIAGCECTAMPPASAGQTCATAIDSGTVSDTGQRQMITGNVLPDDRVVWYRFVATDTPDTTCDNFHVRVLMMTNPGDTFELTVFRGACDAAGCADTGFTDYRFATDLQMPMGGMTVGECPCSATTPGVNRCSDQSGTYYVRVRRRAGAALSCGAYTIEISNGIYDS